MIDRQYIPLVVFVICLTLALALAVFTGEWPVSLAIALSGCALALAMRVPETVDHDTAFIEEDVADLRTATDRHAQDITVLRTSVDEVAEIVESLATDLQGRSGGIDKSEIEALRGAVEAMGERVAAVEAPAQEASRRLDALEQSVTTLGTDRAQAVQGEEEVARHSARPVALAANGSTGRPAAQIQAAPVQAAPVQAAPVQAAPTSASVSAPAPKSASATPGGGSITKRAERLRDRFSRGRKPRRISASPIFDRNRTPLSLMIDDPEEVPSVEGTLAVLQHALALATSSEGPDFRVFVRLPVDVVPDDAFAAALGDMLENAGATPKRLVAMLPQAAVAEGLPRALTLLLDAGARFGLERMTDWSADLDTLAKRGLVVIAVDGPAMAKSAMSQKGDPTRLQQVLHARGLNLLAGEIETRMQIDAVGTLVPDLLAGPGLGEATVLDAAE